TSILPSDAMASWGWRVPFFFALPLGYVGMYMRSRMEDSPVFLELEARAEERDEAPAGVYKDLMTIYLRPTLTLFGLVIALNVVDYTFLAFSPTYLQNTVGLSESAALV